MKEIRTTKRYKAFSDGSSTRKFMVGRDGAVHAWDSLAGYYTPLHSLTRHQQALIRHESTK